MSGYEIAIAGGDTATHLNLSKRLALIEQYIVPGVSIVLDGGSGEGEYVCALREKFDVEAWGIEYLDEKVDAFKSRYPERDWVSQGDLENLDFDDNTFDVAILNEVLEHVPDDAQALREIHRVLKPGGTLIVFSPNRLFPFESHGVHMRHSGKTVPEYVPLIPYIPLSMGNKVFKYWARNYWPTELRKLVRGSGFSVLCKPTSFGRGHRHLATPVLFWAFTFERCWS